jgi:hypothetical protein
VGDSRIAAEHDAVDGDAGVEKPGAGRRSRLADVVGAAYVVGD